MDYYNFKGCKIKNIISLNEIITISKQRFSGGCFFRGESHNFYEIVYVLKGSMGVTAGKNFFVLSEGQMTIHPPLEFHALSEYAYSDPECIIFSFSASAFPKLSSHIFGLSHDLIQNLCDMYESSKSIFHMEPDTQADMYGNGNVEFDFGLTVTGIKDNMQYEASKLVKGFELFMLSVLESPQEKELRSDSSASEGYSKILEVMEEHINDKLNMNELSALCGMSAPTIEKTMYKYLRCGAMAYYNDIRMNKAHYLLSQGESVKNVAYTLSFSTQNYFSLSFKKHFGYSPSRVKIQ